MELLKVLFVLLGALFIGYSISILERAYAAHVLKREYLKRSFAPIGNLEGLDVKLRGTVAAGERILQVPFSGRPAVYYKVQIRKKLRDGRVKTLHREQDSVPFTVTDETGRVHVNANQGRFIIRHGTIQGYSLSPDAVKNLEEKLAPAAVYDIESYEIFEEYLGPGESVIVMGTRRDTDISAPVGAYKKLPLLVMVCSEEAFIVLQMRALTRLLFTAFCLFFTGLFDLFLAFTINFSPAAKPPEARQSGFYYRLDSQRVSSCISTSEPALFIRFQQRKRKTQVSSIKAAEKNTVTVRPIRNESG